LKKLVLGEIFASQFEKMTGSECYIIMKMLIGNILDNLQKWQIPIGNRGGNSHGDLYLKNNCCTRMLRDQVQADSLGEALNNNKYFN
jgi:hypothetical protein